MAKAKEQKEQKAPASKIVPQSYEMVAVGDLKPHPKNARKSDNAAIDESIASNGFFGAVCVQRSTGFILAGKHRWERAQTAGIDHIPVLWLDVDDKAALRILSADNRVLDKAGYDEEALAKLLTSIQSECGSLEGTGYTPEDYSDIIAQVGDEIMRQAKDRVRELAPPVPEPETVSEPEGEQREFVVVIRCEDEPAQLALLQRLSAEGLNCTAACSKP
jgi:ParB-like chromosome segregation protein Spo0J